MTWWIVGWIVGGAVVLVAAVLLVTIIALARRIVGQAGAIVAALNGARGNTEPLFDIANVNYSLEQITRKLHEAFDPDPPTASGGVLGRLARGLRSLREREEHA
jgi:hypothetical protein